MEPVERIPIDAAWRHAQISADATIAGAMERFESASVPWLAVCEEDDRLAGLLLDGRLRRAVLSGVGLHHPIRALVDAPALVLEAGDDGAERRAKLASAGVTGAPVVDADGRLAGIDWRPPSDEARGVETVIMAGGLGKRLRPLTDEMPKPMLHVGGKPVLEHTIPWLAGHGFRSLTFCLHFKADRFRSHFGDGSRFGTRIEYVEEAKLTGTAGPLRSLRHRVEDTLLVLNGDLLTQVDLLALLRFHREQRAEATMAVCRYDSQSRFGVVQLDGAEITGIAEKPVTTQFVNAGIYLLEPTALDRLPPAGHADMPELFTALAAAGRRTVAFPIFEYWTDIGWLHDLDRASTEFPAVSAGEPVRRNRFEPARGPVEDRGRRFAVAATAES